MSVDDQSNRRYRWSRRRRLLGASAAASVGLAMLSPAGLHPALHTSAAASAAPIDPVEIARSHLRDHASEVGVAQGDVADTVVASSYQSRHNKVTHVNLTQRFEGLEVFGAQATVNVASDGEVIFVGDSLVKGLAADSPDTPSIGARDAVLAAAEALDLKKPKRVGVVDGPSGRARTSVVSATEVSDAPIPARLGWQPTKHGLRLAWQLVIDETSSSHVWNTTVDAASGALLRREDWTSHDNLQNLQQRLARPAAAPKASSVVSSAASSSSASAPALTPPDPVRDGSKYRVFPLPADSPNDAAQSVVTEPADALGSPFGWHDTNGAAGAESATTRGNNVHSYLDQDANNGPDFGTSPPFRAHSGESYVYSQISERTFKRLTREVAVPAAGGSLEFWANYDIEPGWDHLFVEARTAGGDDWTTLPDANGNTSGSVGESCHYNWRRIHPHLDHYQTFHGYGLPCDRTGTTGEWHAATGASNDWRQWSVDLGGWAGRTVEVSISYATDDFSQGVGVGIDDITLPDGTTASFDDDLGGWTVGSPKPTTPTNWSRVEVAADDADVNLDDEADLREHPQNYREASTTNLFYVNNVIHDVMYRYGFDEAAGNFQSNNYDRGGTAGDYLRAEDADGEGYYNANFLTPVETPASGGEPRMQMFLFPSALDWSTGEELSGLPNQVVADGVGEFDANIARFGAAPSVNGTTGVVYDAGGGCAAADYAGHPAGEWVAIVTGNLGVPCYNVDRARQAEAAGAAALIVAEPLGRRASRLNGELITGAPTIPVASVSRADGDAIRTAAAAGPVTVTVRKHPDHPGIRTSSLDNGIVIHEYAQGISQRLTGGPTVNCLTGQEQAGEGWSDYLAIAMTLDPALDDPDTARGEATYVSFEDDRHAAGFREAPYSRNMSIQPFTYDSIKTSGWLEGGSLSAPHGVGHGWAAVLWDLTWDLIDKHGFNPDIYDAWDTGGNNRAMQYVIDGLKFQGCAPGFVAARDAIVAAADENSNGEDTCTVWASFARRGLGYSAVQGTTARNDNTEAFDTHPDCKADFLGETSHQPTINTVPRGSTVPLEFSLGEDRGLDVLAEDSPYSRRVECDTLQTRDSKAEHITPRPLPVPARSAGGAGVSYDSSSDTYTFPWKTEQDWAGTCREFVLTRTDGVQHRAYFRFRATPSFTVSGRVTLAASAAPIPNATVTIDGPVFLRTRTDESGFYSFEHVPKGSYEAAASAFAPCAGPLNRSLVVSGGAASADFAVPRCPMQRLVAADGTQPNGSASQPGVSADGRYVAFHSAASNLVPGDTNGATDVFVYDWEAGSTERVSVASDGTEGNASTHATSAVSVSADGRYVTFVSNASNLVPGDTNGLPDVFVHDRDTDTTERVSVGTEGTQANGSSQYSDVSGDGRYVVFASSSTNLVAGDTNGTSDIFVRDRDTGTTQRVSVASDGGQADGDSNYLSISADGRYVSFASFAGNLDPDHSPAGADIFVHDRVSGTTELVSVAVDGTQPNGPSSGNSMSGDGRYIAFESGASNLVSGDTNGVVDVFVYDRDTDTTERVSVADDGAQVDFHATVPSISADGRYVAFESRATNLVPGDANDESDVFLYDRETGTVERVSDAAGADVVAGNGRSTAAAISGDGRNIAFESRATNLVPGDTNAAMDVFVRDRGPAAGNAPPAAVP